MKNFLCRRVLPLICVAALTLPLCCVAASAAWDPEEDESDLYSVAAWESALTLPQSLAVDLSVYIKGFYAGGSVAPVDIFWQFIDHYIELSGRGEVSLAELHSLCEAYNDVFNSKPTVSPLMQIILDGRAFGNDLFSIMMLGKVVDFTVRYDSDLGVYRIYCEDVAAYAVDSLGRYPYAKGSDRDHWISKDDAEYATMNGVVNIYTTERLSKLIITMEESGLSAKLKTLPGSDGNPKYYGIYAGGKFYADANGNPYVSPYNSNEWEINNARPDSMITDENGNIVQQVINGNYTGIDVGGLTVTLPNGDINFIDSITYDNSSKTYNIDASQTVYEGDTYNYYTYNYSYEWTYHVNYTSITYIGQTEEYDKYYEVYYELPDGRDSADLTREELEQLNLAIDVIPYGRSTDDTSLRSLYHFDGDTKDSSYWNYTTGLTWNKGASLTYMDAGVFNGALYLDETEHDFTMKLPSGLGAGDFTLQFRYYQSHTATPQTDSYIKFGDTVLMQFDGDAFRNSSGTALAETPVGTWNEIALIRDSGKLYYYLNGVSIGSVDLTSAFGTDVTFHFGSSQQTYKYFDELRILNYALVTGGVNYEPTSVPHDTNLALVLPTDSTPVADEYWSITSSGENLFTEYDIGGGTASEEFVSDYGESMGGYTYYNSFTPSNVAFPQWGLCYNYNQAQSYDGYTSLTNLQPGGKVTKSSSTNSRTYGYNKGLMTALWHQSESYASAPYNTYLADGTYTLSVVLSDGTVSSFTFTTATGVEYSDSAVFDWGTIGTYSLYHEQNRNSSSQSFKNWQLGQYLYIEPNEGTTIDIRHIELVVGDSTDLKAEFVSAIVGLSPDQLNTPTLAVRTDLEITGIQIGGVRPSIPQKGQVWALVESQRITSIQIYNGSAWEACDGRIWTGSRWIPASSYNVITLQDMYDIADATPDYEYIYSESGFWSWWQKSWNAFQERLFKALESAGLGAGCDHAYAIQSTTEATCSDPGERIYRCPLCDGEYIEEIPALGHDWIQTEETEDVYQLPEGTSCPTCSSLDFDLQLDEETAAYSCTCNSCQISWTVPAEVEAGKRVYRCSRCDATTTDPNQDQGFFDALGNFLADGVEWITAKLKQLVDSLSGITATLEEYAAQLEGVGGQFPSFLAAAVEVMPEDLMITVWFSVIVMIALAVWLKFFR